MAVGSYSLKKLGREWLPSVEVMLDLAKEVLDLEFEYDTNNTEEIKITLTKMDGRTKVYRSDAISRIQTASYKSPIRMMHPDEWIIDDWLDETMGDFQEGERKFRQELLGTRTAEWKDEATGGAGKGTIVNLLGTILREDDLLHMMSKGELGNFTFYGKFHAYLEIEEGETYSEKELSKMTPTWNRRPHKFLMAQRKDQGDHIFQVEYLLNPISDKSALIKHEWIDHAKKMGENLSYGRRKHKNAITSVSAVDFQVSPDGDWGVIMSMEAVPFDDDLEKKPRVRILEMERERGWDDYAVLDYIYTDYNKYRHDLVGFEDNGFQAWAGNRAIRDKITFPLYRHNTTGKTYKRKSSQDVQHSGKGMDKQKLDLMARHNIGLLRSTMATFDLALPTATESDREKTAIITKELRGWQWDNSKGRYVHKGKTKDTSLGLLIGLITLDIALGSSVDVEAVDLDNVEDDYDDPRDIDITLR